MKTTIVIPARLGSTRLPEKALADIGGKPMVVRVWERACQVRRADEVLVATDDQRIVAAVEKHGGKAVMTPVALSSGTDRVAFVAREDAGAANSDIFVNVQGDEPLLDPIAVERAIELVRSGRFSMSTSAAPLQDLADLRNPNVVKVLVARDGAAVYFSRYAIPYSRTEPPANVAEASPLHHLGVYAYVRETLLRFSELERSPWEAAESLEQLRALHHGMRIGVAPADRPSTGVDTLEDLERARRRLAGTS